MIEEIRSPRMETGGMFMVVQCFRAVAVDVEESRAIPARLNGIYMLRVIVCLSQTAKG